MKYLMIFMALILSNLALAQSEIEYADASLKPMPTNIQDKVSTVFWSSQLKRSFVGYRGSKLLGINMLFTDAFFQSKIAIKYNLKGNFKFNKVYELANSKVYHFKLNQVPTAIMYQGIETRNILTIVAKLKSIKVSKSDFSFIAHAYADECMAPEITSAPGVDTNIASNSAASMVTDCLSDMGDGAYESTIGTLESIGSGISNEWSTFWDNPSKRMGEYWGFVESGLGKLWEFTKTVGEMLIDPIKGAKILKKKFGEIGQFFIDAYKNIASMPLQTKVSMICNIIGSIGTDVLITAITVGSAGGKLGLTIAKVLNKLRKISKIVGKGVMYPFKILNELSEKVLEKISNIIKSGNKRILDRKIKEVGCAI